MANVKKLQNEIVRVMRKIDEGCALFDDIWDKVHRAESSNLREKYEGELKKEIKKLQRLREQVISPFSPFRFPLEARATAVDAKKSASSGQELVCGQRSPRQKRVVGGPTPH
eukprot:scaffold2646_cov226-Pinguiococcus_pyrenoidosus.AAC.5